MDNQSHSPESPREGVGMWLKGRALGNNRQGPELHRGHMEGSWSVL